MEQERAAYSWQAYNRNLAGAAAGLVFALAFLAIGSWTRNLAWWWPACLGLVVVSIFARRAARARSTPLSRRSD